MNKYHDNEYLTLIQDVIANGVQKGDRTGTGTISLPFQQMRFDLSDHSIPLLTTKQMHVKSIIHEILWYLNGDTNIKYLQENGVRIWNEWSDDNGNLGPIYGAMWRKWPGKTNPTIDWTTDPPHVDLHQEYIDQIERAVELIKYNPNDRRIIINAWNPTFLPDDNKNFAENVKAGNQALPPCHAMFQFWVHQYSKEQRTEIFKKSFLIQDNSPTTQALDAYNIPKGELKCHLYQRSADGFLGVPFNIVQYSILTHMIAHVTGYKATEFVWTGGDVHLYNNHIDKAKLQLTRIPYQSPTLSLNSSVTDIDTFTFDDFKIHNYNYHPPITAKVSV
jgi:thymidylate synthase